jgi:hypothetical protein
VACELVVTDRQTDIVVVLIRIDRQERQPRQGGRHGTKKRRKHGRMLCVNIKIVDESGLWWILRRILKLRMYCITNVCWLYN